MKRSYEEIFINSRVDEDEPRNKKQKIDLSVFSHLPAEMIVNQIVPFIAYDWLYLSREWHQIARVRLPSDQRIRFTRTSLMAVVARNDIIGVKIHIDSRKLTEKDLCEAFVFACSNSFDEIIDLLLNHPQVDPHYHNDIAINNAIIRGDYKLVKRFIKGNYMDLTNFSAFMLAVKRGHYNIVKLLLKPKIIDPSSKDNAAIIEAASSGHFKIVKLLLKDPRVDPSADDNLAICNAAKCSYDIVKLLLKDPRVDPTQHSNLALNSAIEHAQYKIVKLLLKDPRVDPSDNTHGLYLPPITHAGDYKILKLLLKDPRSDPTVADNAMIRRAVNNDREDLVQLLLKHPRTDPLGPGGYEGMTTIDIAVERMNLKMLQLILADPRVDFLHWSGYAILSSVTGYCFEAAYALLKDPRVVIGQELFENISRTLQLQKIVQNLVPFYGDFLDLLELKRYLE
jgi:hypothetical protein